MTTTPRQKVEECLDAIIADAAAAREVLEQDPVAWLDLADLLEDVEDTSAAAMRALEDIEEYTAAVEEDAREVKRGLQP